LEAVLLRQGNCAHVARCLLWWLGALLTVQPALAQPFLYGDLDGDDAATSADVVRLINHLDGTDPLPSELLPFADADRAGGVNQSDLDWVVRSVLGEVGLFATDPLVRFSSGIAEVNEGDPDAAIHVDLNGYAVGTLTYTVTDVDAVPGTDYTPLTGSLAVDGIGVRIPLGLIDDTEREGFETLEVTITGLTGFTVTEPRTQRVFIRDNETLWSLQLGNDIAVLGAEMEIHRVGDEVVGGRLVSDGKGTVPEGSFDLTITSTPTLFDAVSVPIPVPPENTVFGVAFTRQFRFLDEFVEVPFTGTYLGEWFETYQSDDAPIFNITNQETFFATERRDARDDTDLMLGPLP
jgi:hypothetical protein